MNVIGPVIQCDDKMEGGVLGSDGVFYTFDQWHDLQHRGLAAPWPQLTKVTIDPKAAWPFPEKKDAPKA